MNSFVFSVIRLTAAAAAAAAVAVPCLLVASGIQCGGHGGWDLGNHGYEGHDDYYYITHHKVAKVSYAKTPFVSTHDLKKPVISYISKPAKSVHFVSVHSIPVIKKATHHSNEHGW